MASQRKAVAVKKKKLWFKLLSPDIFNNIELGEIAAFEGKSLVNRIAELTYSSIIDNSRDSSKKFAVRVTKVTDDKAHTEPIGITYSESYVQRMKKRYASQFIVVDKVKAENCELTYKLYILVRLHIVSSIRSALIEKTKDFMKKHISKIKFERLFEPNYLESLCKEIKKDLKLIYPIDRIIFWKVVRE